MAELLSPSRSAIKPRFPVVKERNPTLLDFIVLVERMEFAVGLFTVAFAHLNEQITFDSVREPVRAAFDKSQATVINLNYLTGKT